MTIAIGEEGEAGVAYDLDLCRVLGAWTGKIDVPAKAAPAAKPSCGGERCRCFAIPGGGGWFLAAPAARHLGRPAPRVGRARSRKGTRVSRDFFVNHSQTILKWNIGGTEVMELPGLMMWC